MKYLATIFLLLGTLAGQGASLSQFPGLEDYCYPKNAAVTLSKPYFTSDGLSYLTLADDGRKIVKRSIKTGEVTETVMDLARTRENTIDRIEGFEMSPDGGKILVYTNKQMIYRRSFTAQYYTYELHSRILRPLSEDQAVQRAPLFSPDGRMAAFVGVDNNIYIKKIDYNTQVAVTRDGCKDAIINGVPDWTYEEEFSTSQSMAWAPDNLTLCFIKFNETDVRPYSFPLYEGTCEPKKQYELYPGQYVYKYPVAGTPNSRVTVHSYDVETKKLKEIAIPDPKVEYIPRIEYAYAPDRLVITTLNRAQTRMELYAANPRSATTRSLLVEQEKTWLEPATYENLSFDPQGFVVLSARSGRLHAYRYSYSGSLVKQLTRGDWDVTDYYGTDARGTAYFQSNASGPANREVCSVDAKGIVKTLSPEQGTSSAWFTPSMAYFILNHNSSSQAPVYTLNDQQGKKLRTLEDNAAANEKYASAPQREFIEVPSADPALKLCAFMVKPPKMEPGRRYPVIMYQYSGPGSQEVLNRWKPDWYQYAAMQGYVILCVDPRGTAGRGRAFETIVYKNLGHYETLDQIAAAKYAASLPFVDPEKIIINGWSYGGYETLMCATAPASPFAGAIAIAPVTDWRFYDTVYAERYMLTPQENPDGYRSSAPLNRADNLKCPLLIMHGTADDNVHLMNTIQFVSALQSDGILCDMLLFPNMNHSINFCNARAVVYAKLLEYANRICL